MSRPSQTKSKQALERLLNAAEEAWDNQDYRKSIGLIEGASRRDPSNPALLLELARVHGLRYDFPAAERCLEKAVRISPQQSKTLEEAGRICLQFEHIDMAIGYLERASRKNGVSIGSLVTLAEIHLREGRLDAAADLVARAAQMNRNDSRVVLEEAALRRLRGETGEAEWMLRAVLSSPTCLEAVRIRGSYELAGILDRAGRYEEAMSALLEAKAVQQVHAAPHAATLEHIQNRAREMEQSITADVLARWRAVADQLLPLRRIALLCGHPRAGTTLLEQVLDAHPDIVSAEETKIMHDDAYLPLIRDLPEGTSVLQALDTVPLGVVRHARENYFRCIELFLQEPVAGRLLVDKNPALNAMIPMVARVFPETKFLVALRDPRDVVVSCFMQALPLTPISSAYLSLEGTVSQYASTMGFWLEMRPRLGDQWLEVRYEKVVADLPSVARSTLGFLGVEFDDSVLKFHEHARTKRVRSPSRADVTKPVYRSAVGRWRNYERYLAPHLPALQRFLEAFGYS